MTNKPSQNGKSPTPQNLDTENDNSDENRSSSEEKQSDTDPDAPVMSQRAKRSQNRQRHRQAKGIAYSAKAIETQSKQMGERRIPKVIQNSNRALRKITNRRERRSFARKLYKTYKQALKDELRILERKDKQKRTFKVNLQHKIRQVDGYANKATSWVNQIHQYQVQGIPKWDEAMRNEIMGLIDNGTFTWTKRTKDMKVIHSRWVLTIKKNAEGFIKRYKARLVARLSLIHI